MPLKRLFGLVVWLTMMAAVAQAQNTPQTEQKTFLPPLGSLELQDGDSIVFLGDSITHQRLYTQYVEDFFYTRFPNKRLTIHNAGVGGARALDALDRFDKDVAAYKPKYVTILLGMNDGTYRSYDEATFQTYQQDMTKVLNRIAEMGAVAIPMTPTMYDTRAHQIRTKDPAKAEATRLYNSVMAYYGMWLQEEAYARGLGFVDMYHPLNQITREQREKTPNFTMIPDAVHPGPDGHVIMAAAMIRDLGLAAPVASVQVRRNADGTWSGKGQKAKLEGVQGNENSVSFTVTAESLPWVLPENAQLGVKLTYLGHRCSKESLQVIGLAPGKYELSIDGTSVGTYTDVQLGQRVELQGNSKTPQYQQALQIAELNKQRNEGPIGELRAEWLKFQRYSREKRNSANANAAAKLEPEIATMDERVTAINAKAKEIEDKIFEINKSQARKYELKLVK